MTQVTLLCRGYNSKTRRLKKKKKKKKKRELIAPARRHAYNKGHNYRDQTRKRELSPGMRVKYKVQKLHHRCKVPKKKKNPSLDTITETRLAHDKLSSGMSVQYKVQKLHKRCKVPKKKKIHHWTQLQKPDSPTINFHLA